MREMAQEENQRCESEYWTSDWWAANFLIPKRSKRWAQLLLRDSCWRRWCMKRVFLRVTFSVCTLSLLSSVLAGALKWWAAMFQSRAALKRWSLKSVAMLFTVQWSSKVWRSPGTTYRDWISRSCSYISMYRCGAWDPRSWSTRNQSCDFKNWYFPGIWRVVSTLTPRDSAIRITSLTNRHTVVECQDERSQHKNKAKSYGCSLWLVSFKLKKSVVRLRFQIHVVTY